MELVSQQQELCVICLNTHINPVILPCLHTYCKNCIESYLNITCQCPLCRRVFCNLIGEELQFLEESSNQGIQNKQQSNYKSLAQKCAGDKNSFLSIPRVQYINQLQPSSQQFKSQTEIQAVNMALKTNLLVAFQYVYLQEYRMCDVYLITKIQKVNEGGVESYICEMEKIKRAKILKKREEIVECPGFFSILSVLTVVPIIDNYKGEQQQIYQLLKRIQQTLLNLNTELLEPSKSYFGYIFPSVPSLNSYSDIDNQELLNKITNFSTDVIEVLLCKKWENLKINYNKCLTKRLQFIDEYLLTIKYDISILTNLTAQQ